MPAPSTLSQSSLSLFYTPSYLPPFQQKLSLIHPRTDCSSLPSTSLLQIASFSFPQSDICSMLTTSCLRSLSSTQPTKEGRGLAKLQKSYGAVQSYLGAGKG